MTVEQKVLDRGAEPAGNQPDAVAAEWVQRLAISLVGYEQSSAQHLFLADGWWRDLLVTSWDFRSMHGRGEIDRAIADALRPAVICVELDPRLPARYEHLAEGDCVLSGILLTTAIGVARGVVRLRPEGDGWKAWTLMTGLQDLTGHEQARGTRRPLRTPAHGVASGQNWREWRDARKQYAARDPDVVVIGAGHGGLMTAAHLGFWGVDTLVIDRNRRVGDNWRNRYRSLVLHDAIWADHLPGMPFPDSWPVYMSKDKLGDWLECYSEAMELNVWTSTQIIGSSYDDEAGRWQLRLRQADGAVRTVRPQHVVVAIGVHGTPKLPDFPGIDCFSGSVVHSSAYTGKEVVAGTRAIVVGAGNSAHDVAQDLVGRGFEVTMLQRSSTYIISQQQNFEQMVGRLYHEDGLPIDDADILGNSIPFRLQLRRAVAQTAAIARTDREMLDGLERAGYHTDMGIEGAGGLSKILSGPGGYYLDVGCAQLIIEGQITMVHSPVARFTQTGIEFADGTSGDFDLVVMATGYTSPRDTARTILGPEVDRCKPVWGLDDNGELSGVWRPSGHPGLWFMGGPLYIARFYSRYLALQVHASVHGIRSVAGITHAS